MERRAGPLLIAGGCLPFAAGALLDGGTGLPCPFRAATGLPCPLCGATRAFVLAAHGDAAFWRFNAAWVVLAVLAVLAGVLVLLRPRTVPRLDARVAVVLFVAIPWAYALAQRQAIVS